MADGGSDELLEFSSAGDTEIPHLGSPRAAVPARDRQRRELLYRLCLRAGAEIQPEWGSPLHARFGVGQEIAIDYSNDDVFIDHGGDISHFDSKGALLDTFGTADPEHSYLGLGTEEQQFAFRSGVSRSTRPPMISTSAISGTTAARCGWRSSSRVKPRRSRRWSPKALTSRWTKRPCGERSTRPVAGIQRHAISSGALRAKRGHRHTLKPCRALRRGHSAEADPTRSRRRSPA